MNICLSAVPSYQEVSQQLTDIGWSPISNSDLNEPHFRSYAAHLLVNKMANSNAPAVRWAGAWELSLNNARGLKRTISMENSPSQKSFFVHNESGSFLEVRTENYSAYESLHCEVIATTSLAPNSLTAVADSQLTPEMPPVVAAKNRSFDVGNVKRTLGIHYFQRDKISHLIQDDFPFVANFWVLNTQRN